jgi:hypothetical protein
MNVSSSFASYPSRTLMQPVHGPRKLLSEKASHIGLQQRLPPAQPNTSVTFELYNDESLPVIPSPLSHDAWYEMLAEYPGRLRDDICGMIRHGAKLGYDVNGELRHRSRRTEKNLPMSSEAAKYVEDEILRRSTL